MKNKQKWIVRMVPVFIFLLAFGIYFGFSILNQDGQKGSRLTPEQKKQLETVAIFQEEEQEYQSVGAFIEDFHAFYNKSLGWGGIDSVDWKEQQETAAEITAILEGIQTDHRDLQADFEKIASYAKAVDGGRKEKQALLNLHRYFHDLDIEFNGYSRTQDYFNITEFKSGNE